MPHSRLALLALIPFLSFACVETKSEPLPSSNSRTARAEAGDSSSNSKSTPSSDWPQWRGPDRTGIAGATGLTQQWPKEGPELLWTIKGLGEGYSTPSISGGRIYTMGNLPDGKKKSEFVIALNEQDGKELWTALVGSEQAGGGGFPGPRCTPTVDGDCVYALGLNSDLVCLKSATGKLVWRKNLVTDFGGRVGGWDYCESPLIDGDKLICTPGGSKATLVALDKKTGKEIWRSAVPGGDAAHFSSAVAAEVDGVRMYVQFLSGGVVGVAAEDGKFLWRYKAPANGTANCSTPIVHDGHVFAASAYGTGGGLVKLSRKGDQWEAKEVWFDKQFQNHHGNAVLHDGYIYGEGGGRLTCLEWKTGKAAWREGKAGKGSICYADGRLFYRPEGGQMLLVEANPEKYVEQGRFNQPERSGKPAWPHPVVANGRLYLRDQDKLLCYAVKAE